MMVLIWCVSSSLNLRFVFGQMCKTFIYVNVVVVVGNWTIWGSFHILFLTICSVRVGGLAAWVLMIKCWCAFVRSSVYAICATFIYIISLFLAMFVIVCEDIRLLILALVLILVLVLVLVLVLDSLCLQLSLVINIPITIIICCQTCW